MDDVGRCILGTVFFILLTIIAMLLSLSEVSICNLSESRLKHLEENSNKNAKSLLRLKENEFDFSLWVSLGGIVSILLACCVGVFSFTPLVREGILRIVSLFTGTRVDFLYSDSRYVWLSLLVTLALSLLISLTFGYSLPKRLAYHKPEKFALSMITPIAILSGIFKPLTFPARKLSKLLLYLFGITPTGEAPDITEEEIRMMVDVGNENGTIELSQREMINNVFEFDDRTAFDVMTHRTDLFSVSKTDSLKNVIKLILEEGFSRIPVYADDIDDIIGVIYAKDLLALIGDNESYKKTISEFMRTVIYMPESTNCRTLFLRFKEEHTHMAVIVDEYGGTAGIVTMEDLIESIVGSIQDEYDSEDDEISRIDDEYYSLDGSISVDDVERLFDIELSADDSSDTLGGLIANTLGRIPTENENPFVIIENVEFTVLLVEDRRILRVKARKFPG